MFFKNNDSKDYQLSEEYLEERKKRYPKSHLYILFHIECRKIEKAEKRKISCYERTNRWIEFEAKHGPSNVVPESPSLAFAEDKENPKFSNLSLETVETKNIPPDASNSEVTEVSLNHTYKPAENCEKKCEAGNTFIDSKDYQLSEEYLEERKKRYPKSHLYILFHIECRKIEKAEKRKISCYERTNRWIEFKAKHGPSNVDSADGDYQHSEEYLEKMKKLYPRSHL